jgi:hypothetical protein
VNQQDERDYREVGKSDERQLVICPTCQRAIGVEGEQVTCTKCNTVFAVADAKTVVENNATRALVYSLEGISAPALSPEQKLIVTGVVVGTATIAAVAFGWIGLVSVLIFVAILAMSHRAQNPRV